MEIITHAAASVTPHVTHLLDIGCGAGNYSLKMLQTLPNLDISIVDLRQRVLERACERLHSLMRGTV
ncbi:MAG: class I SAM-dependent methyltransferase [Chloroflexota bacterium]